MNNKLLFLDIDGVLLDYHEAFSRYLKECKNIILPKEQIEFHTHSIEKPTKEPQKLIMIFDKYSQEFMQSEYFAHLKTIGNLQNYQKLAKIYNIFFVSNVPSECRTLRERNLKLRKLNYQQLFFAGEEKPTLDYPSKHEVIQRKISSTSEAVFLDDLVINCNLVKEKIPQIQVFLLDKPYNQKGLLKTCLRVKNWQEFTAILLSS